ncbi:MAG TPA: mannonate dehydratase [Opitutaceae bacterium]|jgi:mannonate dehydratase|nr:mannonate dehydratase [Opitutaceae bacterium]
MKLGLGLYRHMLTAENFRFARQAGATHIVAHLVDYFRGAPDNPRGGQPTGSDSGWGLAGDPGQLWTLEELVALRRAIEAEGLKLEAIENLDPAHWHDILLDGPRRAEHIANVQTIIRRMGEAGIPILGYNFSIAGVAGRITGNFARGQAESVGMDGPLDRPIPRGMVWNMIYDPRAPAGTLDPITSDELWRRLSAFLADVLPVAEASGVKLAAHPDDPPLPTVRGQPRLVWQPHLYQRLIDLNPSPSNLLEYCIGTLAEMTEGDVYSATERYSSQGRLGYVHFRNVHGKAPHYKETFIDDGDIDMARILQILRRNRFDGVLIPDHTPHMSCAAPWHAGMAYAMGYMQAALKRVGAA